MKLKQDCKHRLKSKSDFLNPRQRSYLLSEFADKSGLFFKRKPSDFVERHKNEWQTINGKQIQKRRLEEAMSDQLKEWTYNF